jgi:hypothetical protein
MLLPLAGLAVSVAFLLPRRARAVVPVTIGWEALECVAVLGFLYLSGRRARPV